MKKIKTITWIIIAITFLIAIIGVIFLPDKIAVQWNDQGVSNEGSKFTLLYLPFISLVICAVYMSIAKTLRHIVPLVTSILMLICEVVISVNAFGIINITHIGSPSSNLWIGRIINIIFGIVVMVIGNKLPKTVINYYVGVKTVWAVSNTDIWVKTQRFAGKLWFVFGIVLIVLEFFPYSVRYSGRILVLIILAIAPRMYSFYLYDKKDK